MEDPAVPFSKPAKPSPFGGPESIDKPKDVTNSGPFLHHISTDQPILPDLKPGDIILFNFR